jgi:hypothetical protein
MLNIYTPKLNDACIVLLIKYFMNSVYFLYACRIFQQFQREGPSGYTKMETLRVSSEPLCVHFSVLMYG